jgi:branched-chain amino acid transport system permease protein
MERGHQASVVAGGPFPKKRRVRMVTDIACILVSGIFYASTLFLVATGLQVVFGVQKIFNLACGSFYAMGAYMGITFVHLSGRMGVPPIFALIPLIAGGLSIFFLGPIIERGLLKFIYDRDEHFQLILTFGLILIFEDITSFFWGTAPQSTQGVYQTYGQIHLLGATFPVYVFIVILSSLIIAILIGYMLAKTKFGKTMRATADNREVCEALGINMKAMYVKVFTLGTVLGGLGGALVIPATVAMTEMAAELMAMSFAVVVIGGLGSIKGAFFGALVVGILRCIAIATYPEAELFIIYLIVIGVLVYKPEGLFGASSA